MKISKIASVALLSALIATSASADAKSEYKSAASILKNKQNLAKTIVDTVKAFHDLGWAAIKAWDGSSANIKDLFDAIDAIKPSKVDGTGLSGTTLELKDIDLGNSKKASIIFTADETPQSATIKITDPNIDSGSQVTITGDNDKTNYAKVFVDGAKEDLKKIYEAIVSEATKQKLLKPYVDNKNEAEIAYANDIVTNKNTDTESVSFLMSNQAEVKTIINNKIAELKKVQNNEEAVNIAVAAAEQILTGLVNFLSNNKISESIVSDIATKKTAVSSADNKKVLKNINIDDLVAVNKAIESLKTASDSQDLKTKLQALHEAQVLLNQANITKIDTIKENLNNSNIANVLEGLKDIGTISDVNTLTQTENQSARDILVKGKADTLLALANNISSSAAETAKAINTDAALQAIRVNASLSTDTRLAKLASPHKNDIALAKAINATSGDRFADGGDSVNEVIKAYTTRFKNDNNLWANVIGTKASIKNGISPTMFGFSVGYDKAFDNTILGGYASYAQGNGSNSNLSIKANTYELGAYSRTYIDQSEIDAKIAIGQTRNKLERSVFNSVGNSYLQQNAKFDTTYFNIDTTYGYVFDLGNALFVKPFAGLEYGYSKNKSFDERGDLPLSFSGVKNKTLSAKLGAELRKYVDNENYIYIAPAIISELYKSKSNPSVKFIGSNQEFDIATNKKKNTYFGLNTGISTNITQNTSLNVNFGTKLGSKEKYYNGLVGVKYSF